MHVLLLGRCPLLSDYDKGLVASARHPSLHHPIRNITSPSCLRAFFLFCINMLSTYGVHQGCFSPSSHLMGHPRALECAVMGMPHSGILKDDTTRQSSFLQVSATALLSSLLRILQDGTHAGRAVSIYEHGVRLTEL